VIDIIAHFCPEIVKSTLKLSKGYSKLMLEVLRQNFQKENKSTSRIDRQTDNRRVLDTRMR